LVGILDTAAEHGCPTSKFLTQKEIKTFDPAWNRWRMNFIFKHNIPLYVTDHVAKLLTDKYDSLQYKDGDEEMQVTVEEFYDDYTYVELKKLAVKNGIPYKETFVKRGQLIDLIRAKNGII
jgi:uncharacterized protein with ParB-like and HNH nuclease domain